MKLLLLCDDQDNYTERQIRARKQCPGCGRRLGYGKKKCDNCGHEFQVGKPRPIMVVVNLDMELVRKARSKNNNVSLRQLLDAAAIEILPTLEKQLAEVGFQPTKRAHLSKSLTPETMSKIDKVAKSFDLSRSDMVALLLARMASS
jgi:ribosomal protein L37AE/L43A